MNYLLAVCSFPHHSPMPAKPKKGAEGRRVLALAVQTVYLSFTPGPRWTPETPQQKGSFLQQNTQGLGPPTPGTTSFPGHSVPRTPRCLCQQQFGPAREWPGWGPAMAGSGARREDGLEGSLPLPRPHPPSPGPDDGGRRGSACHFQLVLPASAPAALTCGGDGGFLAACLRGGESGWAGAPAAEEGRDARRAGGAVQPLPLQGHIPRRVAGRPPRRVAASAVAPLRREGGGRS